MFSFNNIEGKLKHELLDNIYESRKKLHGAGRVLLKRFFELKKNLSELDLKYLNKHPEDIPHLNVGKYNPANEEHRYILSKLGILKNNV